MQIKKTNWKQTTKRYLSKKLIQRLKCIFFTNEHWIISWPIFILLMWKFTFKLKDKSIILFTNQFLWSFTIKHCYLSWSSKTFHKFFKIINFFFKRRTISPYEFQLKFDWLYFLAQFLVFIMYYKSKALKICALDIRKVRNEFICYFLWIFSFAFIQTKINHFYFCKAYYNIAYSLN